MRAMARRNIKIDVKVNAVTEAALAEADAITAEDAQVETFDSFRAYRDSIQRVTQKMSECEPVRVPMS
jgi:hypothetical protein